MIRPSRWTRKPTRHGLRLGSLLAISLPAALCVPALPAQAAAARKAWLQSNAVPIETVVAGSGFEDLRPLEEVIGSARIVALGEGTHGTREYFQAKHRLVEYLVEELGFSIFSIEANMTDAYALNDYVLGGEGDVVRLIRGMRFWTWTTEEMRDLVEWMRDYNRRQAEEGGEHRVQFTGFDMQSGFAGLQTVREFLEAHDAEFLQANAEPLASLAAQVPVASGRAFGCATGAFPVAAARGRRVRFSGWIKTEDLTEGRARLWWRVDGPTPSLESMAGGGLTGSQHWQRLVIETSVPDDAEAIYFGALMTGEGRSWFDGLQVEVDGEIWSSPEFDLDFEGDEPRGIVPADPVGGPPSPSYLSVVDSEVSKTGQRSLRFEKKSQSVLTAMRARSIAKDVLEHMESSCERYVAAVGERAASWAIQNARLVYQWAGRRTGWRGYRDECMADNVAWIAEQDPDARIVLWAHNGHVRNSFRRQGSHLRKRFGDDYLSLAFCSSHGQYTAMSEERRLESFPLATPPVGSFESILESAECEMLIIDLRSADSEDLGSAWLTESRPFGGHIGSLRMDDHYIPTRLQAQFDLLWYIRDTTPARQLVRR